MEDAVIQYEGFDALGKIMSGDVDGHINAMYFMVDTSGTGVARDVSDRLMTASDFRALTGDHDFVRVPLSRGSLSAETSAGGTYSSNKITFVGVLSLGAEGELGKTIQAGDKIEAAALVIAPAWSDNTQDLLYAAWAPTAPVDMPASGGYALSWPVRFVHSWT